MKAPEPTNLPLDYASEVAFEICLLRDECINAARAITSQAPLNEAALEECAGLDDALAVAHRAIQSALKRIQISRKARTGQVG